MVSKFKSAFGFTSNLTNFPKPAGFGLDLEIFTAVDLDLGFILDLDLNISERMDMDLDLKV